MTHEELQSLLGAYALDALASDEIPLVEAHLAQCPRCRMEVTAGRETAAALGSTGGEAPPRVWERIEAELGFGNAPSPIPPTAGNVVTLTSRRQLALPVVAAVACVIAVLVGLLGVSTVRLQHQVDGLRNTLNTGGLRQAAAAAVLDPRSSTVDLFSSDRHLNAKIVIQSDGSAYLVNSNLPAVSSRHTYQLWGLDDDRVVSLGLLGPVPRLAAFRVDSAVSRLMVTAEPRGGTPQPDSKVLVQGSRSA